MKKITLFLLLTSLGVMAQTPRFFEFKVDYEVQNWRDTTFIAETNNPTVINELLYQLTIPVNERKFINGPIAAGNNGYNNNATHQFSWHFIPNQWELMNATTELCDGLPYSVVDLDVNYWVNTVGVFCPWSAKPSREVFPTLGLDDHQNEMTIILYPNPSKDVFFVNYDKIDDSKIKIYNLIGQEINFNSNLINENTVEIVDLKQGNYIITIEQGSLKTSKKVIVK